METQAISMSSFQQQRQRPHMHLQLDVFFIE